LIHVSVTRLPTGRLVLLIPRLAALSALRDLLRFAILAQLFRLLGLVGFSNILFLQEIVDTSRGLPGSAQALRTGIAFSVVLRFLTSHYTPGSYIDAFSILVEVSRRILKGIELMRTFSFRATLVASWLISTS